MYTSHAIFPKKKKKEKREGGEHCGQSGLLGLHYFVSFVNCKFSSALLLIDAGTWDTHTEVSMTARARESQTYASVRQRSVITTVEAVLGMTQLCQTFKYSSSQAISLLPPPAFPPCQWCCPRIAAYTEACHCPICFWCCQVKEFRIVELSTTIVFSMGHVNASYFALNAL